MPKAKSPELIVVSKQILIAPDKWKSIGIHIFMSPADAEKYMRDEDADDKTLGGLMPPPKKGTVRWRIRSVTVNTERYVEAR